MSANRDDVTRTPFPSIAAGARSWTPSRLFGSVVRWRQAGIFGALVLMALAFGLAESSYFTSRNLVLILEQSAVTAILAIGATFVIITAGIDLSFGSTVGLAAALLGVMLQAGAPVPAALLAAVALGGVAGLLNGVLTTVLKITPLIITLGTLSIYSGLALIVTGGDTIFELPADFTTALDTRIAGVPISVVTMLVVLAVCGFLLRRTTFGEYCIATGGNAEVARLAGIRIGWYITGAYVVLGLLAGLAAVLTVGRLGAADPQVGADLLLPVIAAAVIGGAKLSGGEGSVAGAVIGAVFISALQAGLTILVVPAFYQRVSIGSVIILAVAFDKVQSGELRLWRSPRPKRSDRQSGHMRGDTPT